MLMWVAAVVIGTLPVRASAEVRVDSWRSRVGDNPAWAASDFDDSAWTGADTLPLLKLDAPPFRGWIRGRFYLPTDQTPSSGWAVNFGCIHTADEIYLNGVQIGGEGRIDRDFVDVFHLERLYPLPDDTLRPGVNTLAIRVQSSLLRGGLIDPAIQFGAFEDLRQGVEARLRFRLWMEGFVLGLLVVVALMAALFYFIGPRQREYLLVAWLFAMLALIYVLESVGFHVFGWRTPFVQRAIVALFLQLPAPIFLFGGLASPRIRPVRWLRFLAGLFVVLSAAYLIIGGLTFARRIEPVWLGLNVIGVLLLFKIAWDVRVWRRAPGLSFVVAGVAWFTVLALADGAVSNRIASRLPFGLLLNTGIAGLVAALAAALVARFNHAVAQMQVLSRQLVATQEAERKRLAAELHNGVAPTLATVKLDLQLLLRDYAQDDEGRPMVEALSQSIEEIRTLSHELRPAVVDQLGLAAALRGLAERLARQHQWSLDLDLPSPLPVLPPEATVSLYRMAQEALYNIVHHANARSVALGLRPLRDGVELRVADNGQGCDPETPGRSGIGWLTLHERTAALGGTCRMVSRPGHGLELVLWIPIP
ncbi:MAG: sensor histidine kinase [Kiritimatiellia bacterium]|jgi:signal transduction histidine kinase|nr:sensor histidine kinase [Kiritimatiellia bacterium]